MKIYITHLLQILNFSSTFRRFEIKNSLCRPTFSYGGRQYFKLGRPQNFFYFYRSGNNHQIYVHLVQSLEKNENIPRVSNSPFQPVICLFMDLPGGVNYNVLTQMKLLHLIIRGVQLLICNYKVALANAVLSVKQKSVQDGAHDYEN